MVTQNKTLKDVKELAKIKEPDEYVPPMSPRPLVLLSGGLDSTYLAYTLLEDTDIDVLYVSGNQGEEKIAAEKAALERIYTWLAKNRKYRIIDRFTSDIAGISFNTESQKFAQANWWIMSALGTYTTAHSSVCVAYVCGDQINCYVSAMQAAWNSLVQFTKTREIPLTFPLIFKRKPEIMADMPEKLRNLTWTCEIPRKLPSGKYRACGSCLACNTRRINLFAHKFSTGEIDRLMNDKKKEGKK